MAPRTGALSANGDVLRTTPLAVSASASLAPTPKGAESYPATKAHELTHWTSHPHRLARDFGAKCFGDTGYAREELVAEIGSCALTSR